MHIHVSALRASTHLDMTLLPSKVIEEACMEIQRLLTSVAVQGSPLITIECEQEINVCYIKP